jgi:diacylglycerol O-acyltransferase / wax synthase
VPQNGSIGVGLSILSYHGHVHFGIMGDTRCVADPDEIVQRFVREVEKLTLITLMEDWNGDIHAGDAEATLTRFG